MTNKKISMFSLWRDSVSYILNSLSRLDDLILQNKHINFSFYFYENDSQDETVSILNNWMKDKRGKILSENVGFNKEGSVFTESRMKKMCYYRNRMINLGRYIDTDYSIVFDSDVIYSSDIINKFLSKIDEETLMYTPNITQNIKCKICNCGRDSYYDSSPFFDKRGEQGLTWSCNPFTNVFDRFQFESGQPVEVNSAFGGFALFKGDVLNHCNWTFDGLCDHVSLCKDVRKYGKIKIYPDINVRVELDDETVRRYE